MKAYNLCKFNCCTGDPTFFGNLPVHQMMKEAVKEAVDSDQFNGYGPAHGTVYTSEVLLLVTYYRSGVCQTSSSQTLHYSRGSSH